MGFAHILGLDDGGERWLCRSCGRIVTIEADGADGGDGTDGAAGADARPDDGPEADPECPNCGSRDVRRLALL